MMYFLSKEKLLQRISHYAQVIVENRQISLRLEKLLPTRFKKIKAKHAQTIKSSKATRLALCDNEYGKFLLEYLEIKEEAHRARIQWETHRMYFYARKTSRKNS